MFEAMAPSPFAIVEKWPENQDCFSLRLEPVMQDQFSFVPGQFNMLYLFGVGEAPISISDGGEGTLVHTIRAVGGVTKGLRRLQEGTVIGVRGPFGQGWPIEKALGKDVILMAGGIGLAPLRPLLKSLLANAQHYGRIILLYGARSPKDLLYHKEITQLTQSTKLEYYVTVDNTAPGWKGQVGVVTQLVTRALVDPAKSVAFLCGPEIMMRFSVDRLLGRGLEAKNIYLSMEKNMRCGVGLCGHCQAGGRFICKDGPVFALPEIDTVLRTRGL